jgi:hypothetical protein
VGRYHLPPWSYPLGNHLCVLDEEPVGSLPRHRNLKQRLRLARRSRSCLSFDGGKADPDESGVGLDEVGVGKNAGPWRGVMVLPNQDSVQMLVR